MDRPPPEPWKEFEEREMLCNIIKASNINPRDVYAFIAQHVISPSWDHIHMPQGRTPAECKARFESVMGSVAPYPVQPSPFGPPAYTMPTGGYSAPRMRPHFDPQASSGRPLLPKTQPSTPSEAGPAFPQSPLAEQQPAARKRGRPPKEEVSRRRAEAEARGEVYPAPRSKRAKRPPSQLLEASSPSLATPSQTQAPPPTTLTPAGAPPPETGSESSGSKRRRIGRPPDIETMAGASRSAEPSMISYGSPSQPAYPTGQPSSSTSAPDPDTRMEGIEDPAPSSRTQSYREIVGIRGSTSR